MVATNVNDDDIVILYRIAVATARRMSMRMDDETLSEINATIAYIYNAYDPTKGKLKTFAITCFRYGFIDLIRKNNTRLQKETLMQPDHMDCVFSAKVDIFADVDIDQCLNVLNDKERLVIVMRFMEGKLWREVADICNMSITGAITMCGRCLVKMRSIHDI